MVSDTIQDVNQALHNIGMATWVGGTIFGRYALNPAVRRAASHAERGAVANDAWNRFNALNAVALTAVGVGHVGGRMTELRSSNLSERERPLVRAMDVFTTAGVTTGVLTGIQGRRLAKQSADGAVPVETGATPSADTPEEAVRIQKSINALGLVNLLSGIGLVTSTGLFWRSAVSRPPTHRALRRSAATAAGRGPLRKAGDALSAATLALTAAAAGNELRKPRRRRDWHGELLGVPYDFRKPSAEKLRRSYWSPDDRRVFKPRAWGLGWDVNVGRLWRLAAR
jgi:uncharacterized membrane protein